MLRRGEGRKVRKGLKGKWEGEFSYHDLSTVYVRASFFGIEGREGVPTSILFVRGVK